jgi:hypothetical protein
MFVIGILYFFPPYILVEIQKRGFQRLNVGIERLFKGKNYRKIGKFRKAKGRE